MEVYIGETCKIQKRDRTMMSNFFRCHWLSQRPIAFTDWARWFYAARRHFQARSHTYYYDILKISSSATQAEIKSAFYELSKKHHPDTNPHSESEKFHELVEAYEVLGSEPTRKKYDKGLLKPADIEDITTKDVFGLRNYKKKSNVMTGKTEYYDFDEYYRQHYGDQVLKRFKRKQRMSQGGMSSSIASAQPLKQISGTSQRLDLSDRRAIRLDNLPSYLLLFLVFCALVMIVDLVERIDKKNSERYQFAKLITVFYYLCPVHFILESD
ncbi:uncharacterized protein [Watersipora subatra]|uniref:uncharacterized protein n=1 Tax=Watersipora subatra TaxID=2589382 RepID=UPI00355BA733